jgi:hypothetical protein
MAVRAPIQRMRAATEIPARQSIARAVRALSSGGRVWSRTVVRTRTVKNLTEVRFEVQTIGGTEPLVRFEVRGVPAIAEPVRTGSNRFEPIIIQRSLPLTC